MESTVLQGGIQEIATIRESVVALNHCLEQKRTLEAKEKQLERSIAVKEKAIADKIKKVTRERKAQVEDSFDEQINSVTANLKKVEAHKEKSKKKAMVQRMDEETADLRSEEEELQLAVKSVLKQDNIPVFCNNRLFFALYFPRGLGDLWIILLTLAVAFFAIPFALYYAFFEGRGMLYLGLSYIGVILVFGGLYLVVGKTKYKHLDALTKVRTLRSNLQESRKRQQKIMHQIRKDKDESHYELGEFDEEIQGYKRSINELLEQKNKALLDFDNVTADEIRRQITADNETELNGLKADYRETYEKGKENLDKLNKISVKLSTQYEGVLGKEFLTLEKLELMEDTIRAGDAQNIGEALAYITQKKPAE